MPFRFMIVLVLALLEGYLFLKVRQWLRSARPVDRTTPLVAGLVFLLFLVAAVAAAVLRPRLGDMPGWFIAAGVYPYLIWHSAVVFLALVALVIDLVRFPFRLLSAGLRRIGPARRSIERVTRAPRYQRFDRTRRVFLRRSAVGLTGAVFGGTAYGMIVGRASHEQTAATISIRNLPQEFHGFTIGLISDIHSGVYMGRQEMAGYVRAVNELRTDMIVVAGDFVNGEVAEVYPFAEAFAELRAPSGVYGVMGNHDFYSEDPDVVARVVEECGIRLLRNENLSLRKGSSEITLIGVDDPGRSASSVVKLETAARGIVSPGPRILLCHRPYYLDRAEALGIDLTLSGHTHGGQIVFGQFGDLVLTPAALASQYVWGHYVLGNSQMYVSRGVGTVGVPLRINCPPEITTITLVPA